MNTIGIIGGMSWESTASYYQKINQLLKARLGGLHSAKLVLVSVDFAEIETLQHKGDWAGAADILVDAGVRLQNAGADFVIIATNTMHKVASEVEMALSIPLLHIADATASALQADNIQCVGLLGTRFTMEQDFYRQRLADKFGMQVVIPDEQQREDVHRIIYQELCLGQIKPESRQTYLEIIDALQARGAQAVILGCTEIALLVEPRHTAVALYDTTALHAEAAVDFALA